MDYSWVIPENIIDRLDSLPYKRVYIDNLKRLKKHKTQKLFKICDSVKCGPFGSTVLAETYSNEGVLYIRPVNISNNLFDESDLVFLDRLDVRKKNLDIFTNNDLFFGRVGNPCVSKVSKEYSEITISPNIIGVKVGDKIDSDYLWMFLSSRYGIFQIERMLKTVAQPTTSTETIKELDVLVPLPEIQKYIGDKVRKAEELREEAKRLKKEAETFLYEMIQLKPLNDFDKDMFSFVNSNYIDSERLDSEYYKTKYITLEKLLKSKKVTSFKDIIIESKYGASVPADYTMVGIPFIRGNNLTDNEINIDDIVYLNKKLKDEVKDHHVNTGDILITRSGTVGISAVVDEKCDGFSFGSFMIKLRIDMRIWNPYYIAAFLNSFWGKWQIERLQNGAVQQNINLQEIGRIIIPIISKENQDKIEELIKNYVNKKRLSKQLIQEAKQDVEDLIEGNFDMSKVKANS